MINFARLVANLRSKRETQEAPRTADQPNTGQEVLTSVIAALPDPTILLDAEGRVLALNNHALSLASALRRGEPALLALRTPQVVEAIRIALETGEPQRIEFSQLVPTERWWEAFLNPIPGIGASPSNPKLVMSFHDLTPIRRVEEMRADFVANASHELRTPLAALLGFIETLRGPAREDVAARERFLGIMETQARRMARLIDDLLSLSRIELSAHLRPATVVDVSSILHQVVDALQTLAADAKVEVSVSVPDELMVVGDRDELIRVFENLIENAIKYGGSGKCVEIVARHDINEARQPAAIVSVRDFGPGIAAEHLPRLTERFYRVDVAGSRALGGTGLGLALVKHILNRHGGRLRIESKSGEGAVFSATLPAQSV